jgi:hypothetical protein
MSSSGLIYAVIVGAWAVYLVPMWLRREDELNHARQTQRYATAIKVLSNKESFERRWIATADEEVELPLAAGQNTAAPQRRSAPEAAAKSAAKSAQPPRSTRSVGSAGSAGIAEAGRSAKPETGPKVGKTTRPASPAAGRPKQMVTVRVKPGGASGPGPRATTRSAASSSAASTPAAGRPTPTARPAQARGPRTGLVARRRRVVSILFAASTLGAIVSADLGAHYLWAMATPAVLLSAYIVQLRNDEHARAADRARRRSAALAARQARAEGDGPARSTEQRAPREQQPSKQSRQAAQTAARRRSAAARARADRYVQSGPDPELRRAANS